MSPFSFATILLRWSLYYQFQIMRISLSGMGFRDGPYQPRGGCGCRGADTVDFRCCGPWAASWERGRGKTICFKLVSFILTSSEAELTLDSAFPNVPCRCYSPRNLLIFRPGRNFRKPCKLKMAGSRNSLTHLERCALTN